jgi:hypothetical protein
MLEGLAATGLPKDWRNALLLGRLDAGDDWMLSRSLSHSKVNPSCVCWRRATCNASRPAASLSLFRPFEQVIEERWASSRRCATFARRQLLPVPQ